MKRQSVQSNDQGKSRVSLDVHSVHSTTKDTNKEGTRLGSCRERPVRAERSEHGLFSRIALNGARTRPACGSSLLGTGVPHA